MKIAATLFILSVYYIVSTEQAAVPAGVHTYPMTWQEMQHKVQEGMKDFKVNAEAYSRAKVAVVDITIPPELRRCANKDCSDFEGRPAEAAACQATKAACQHVLKSLEAIIGRK